MAKYQPVSRSAFSDKRWKHNGLYHFAAKQPYCQILLQEVHRAMMFLPLAFVAKEEGFLPVVLQSLKDGDNTLVSPEGRWLFPFMPLQYRTYPFKAIKADTGDFVLCFDTDSHFQGNEGESFFDERGAMSSALAEISAFLKDCELDHQRTIAIVRQLQQLGLIEPWPIVIPEEAGKRELSGYYRINETALNALPGEAFLQLRQSGALVLVYGQLLSMQHMHRLSELARMQEQARLKLTEQQAMADAGRDLDLSFMSGSDTLNFGTF